MTDCDTDVQDAVPPGSPGTSWVRITNIYPGDCIGLTATVTVDYSNASGGGATIRVGCGGGGAPGGGGGGRGRRAQGVGLHAGDQRDPPGRGQRQPGGHRQPVPAVHLRARADRLRVPVRGRESGPDRDVRPEGGGPDPGDGRGAGQGGGAG